MTVALAGLAVVVVTLAVLLVSGAFLPRLPVLGFVGSFVTGQYPVHAALGAALGVALAALTWWLGPRPLGVVLTVLAAASLAGTLVVLAALERLARREGVTLDRVAPLTALDQSAGRPDATYRYSVAPDLDLDLYRPAGPGPHPVLVWVHGGSWVRGERTDRAAANRWLAEHGWAVVAVQYRLPPPGPVGEGQRRDVASALAWVADHAAEQGLDPRAVTLGGQSAGATLALSTTSALLDGRGPAPPPRAVAAFYPALDLAMIAPGLQDAVFGGPARRFPDQVLAASPGRQVRPGLPPTLVVLGSADHFVFADRVRAYDADLRAAGVPGRLLVVPYADHVFDHPFGSPGAQIARPALLGFLREYGR